MPFAQSDPSSADFGLGVVPGVCSEEDRKSMTWVRPNTPFPETVCPPDPSSCNHFVKTGRKIVGVRRANHRSAVELHMECQLAADMEVAMLSEKGETGNFPLGISMVSSSSNSQTLVKPALSKANFRMDPGACRRCILEPGCFLSYASGNQGFRT